MPQKRKPPYKPPQRIDPKPEPDAQPRRFIQEYPAATAVGLTGLSALIVWLIELTDVAEVPAAVAAAIAGIIISVGLLIGKYGIKGIGKLVWGGKGNGP